MHGGDGALGRGRRVRAQEARGVGALTSELIKKRTGFDTVYQQLAYLMRSGSPRLARPDGGHELRGDLAADLALEGATGSHGGPARRHVHHRADRVTREGEKRVDVDELYDVAAYRPKVRHAHRQADVPVLIVRSRQRRGSSWRGSAS